MDVCGITLRNKLFSCCYKYSSVKNILPVSLKILVKKWNSLYFFSHYFFEHSCMFESVIFIIINVVTGKGKTLAIHN